MKALVIEMKALTKGKGTHVGTYMFFNRIGVELTWADSTSVDESILGDDYDFVIIPASDNITTLNIPSVLDNVKSKTIPVLVVAYQTQLASNTVTGVQSADTSVATRNMTMINWQGRTAVGTIPFYGEMPTSLDTTAARNPEIYTDDGTGFMAWRYDIDDHPTFWMSTYGSVTTTASALHNWWLGVQWMIDKGFIEASDIIKAHCLLRYDGFNIASTDVVAFNDGSLDTFYDKCVAGGIHELWCAAIHGSAAIDTSTGVDKWWYDRRENGTPPGIVRFMNHETQIGNGKADACTSDGTAMDQFIAAGIAYVADCKILTDAGFKLGSDGLGRDYPHVQNGNDMDNPSAAFIADGYRVYDATTKQWYGSYGCYPWIVQTETYPTGDSAGSKFHPSFNWAGMNTLLVYNGDLLTNEIVFLNALSMSLSCGGGIYIHAANLANANTLYVDALASNQAYSPDVVGTGPFEDLIARNKAGNVPSMTFGP